MGKAAKAVAAVILVGLSLAGAFYAWQRWSATRPTAENFDKVTRAFWEEHSARSGGQPNPVCIGIPMYPAPEARSRSQRPLAWHLDFEEPGNNTQDRWRQRSQLDALVGVGLLEKAEVVGGAAGDSKFTRYRLSSKGWAAAGYGGSNCLVYGVPRYLGVRAFESKAVNDKAGIQIYQVTAKLGFSSLQELPEWARDPQVQKFFPEISKYVEGQDLTILVARGRGDWEIYQSIIQPASASATAAARPDRTPSTLSHEQKTEIERLKALPPPTPDELKARVSHMHTGGSESLRCLDLPGSKAFPVDVDGSTPVPKRYVVTVRLGTKRNAPTPYVGTIEYLKVLEKLGIVAQAPGSPNLATDEATYEMAPALEKLLNPGYLHCFPLGEPTLEFVDVRADERDEYGIPRTTVRYKLRLLYTQAPAWMREPVLLNSRKELHNMLERGRACSGEFRFNRETRGLEAGSASCWWAFESETGEQ